MCDLWSVPQYARKDRFIPDCARVWHACKWTSCVVAASTTQNASKNDAIARRNVPHVPPPPKGELVLVLLPNILVLAALLLEPNRPPALLVLEPKPGAGGVLDLGCRADNVLRCCAIALGAQGRRLRESRKENIAYRPTCYCCCCCLRRIHQILWIGCWLVSQSPQNHHRRTF